MTEETALKAVTPFRLQYPIALRKKLMYSIKHRQTMITSANIYADASDAPRSTLDKHLRGIFGAPNQQISQMKWRCGHSTGLSMASWEDTHLNLY